MLLPIYTGSAPNLLANFCICSEATVQALQCQQNWCIQWPKLWQFDDFKTTFNQCVEWLPSFAAFYWRSSRGWRPRGNPWSNIDWPMETMQFLLWRQSAVGISCVVETPWEETSDMPGWDPSGLDFEGNLVQPYWRKKRSLVVDNEAARMALVKNFSPILDTFFLLQLNARLVWKSAVHRSAVRSNASSKFLQNYAGRRVRQPRTPNKRSACSHKPN